MISPLGRWRLLAPALLGWAVTAWAITLPGTGRWIMFVFSLLGVASVSAALCAPRWLGCKTELYRGLNKQWALLALTCTVLVALGSQIDAGEWRRSDRVISTAASQGKQIELEVTVDDYVTRTTAGSTERYWVPASLLADRGRIPLLLWGEGQPDQRWIPGTVLQLSGRVERLAAGSSAAYGVTMGSLSDARLITAERFALSEETGKLANDLRLRLREAALGVNGAELLPGFAVGDTSLVGEELQEQMLETSLTHLTAVSGSNCALVTSSILWLSSRFGAGRRSRFVLATLALGGFVFIVGPDPSVQRAAVMATVVLVSGYGGKRAHALPCLGVAVLVLLAIDPWQALQPGFALSVAATVGILLLVPMLSAGLRRAFRAPQLLSLPVAVALAAQIACGPLLLLLQPGLPVVGVLANVLAAPAAPLGTGLGLLAMLILPFLEPVGTLIVHVGAVSARWVAATAEICAQLPLARLPWPEGWFGAALLVAVQAAPIIAWAIHSGNLTWPGRSQVKPRSPWQNTTRAPRVVRLGIAVLLCGASGIFLGPTVVAPLTERAGVPKDWAIVACDVGQGDAILLRDSAENGSAILVDTGDEPELLEECLSLFGVRRISLLVLTHDDADHVGALSVVAQMSDAVLVAPPTTKSGELNSGQTSGEGRPLIRELEEYNLEYRVAIAGLASAGPGVRWEILAPQEGSLLPDTNSASLVMRVQVGDMSALLLGDTGQDEHRSLLAQQRNLKVDVVKVAHHGSKDQDPRLLDAVQAKFGLLSVGEKNRYGHPAHAVLERLQRVGTVPLRTDQLGSIALSGSHEDIRAWSVRSPSNVAGDE